jgi:hypothetical protein
VTASPSLLRVSTVLVLALGLAACAKPQAKNPFAAPGTGRGEGSIQVRIENQNFGDATIHAIRGGERIRLGQVTGKSEKSFTMRWNFSLPLEFEVNIIGGQGCGVRPMSVDPGDHVWVRIPTQIGASPCYSGKT